MQTAREAWAAVRPRSSADALRLLPAWRLLEALPNEAAADFDPSSSPAIPTIEGFPICTEDARVQISATHAGASHAEAFAFARALTSFAALSRQVSRGPHWLMWLRMQSLRARPRSSSPRSARG